MKRFLNAINGLLPKDRIYTDELRTLAWGTDASFYRRRRVTTNPNR